MNKFFIILLLVIVYYFIIQKEGYSNIWNKNNHIHIYSNDIPDNIKKYYSYSNRNTFEYSVLKQYKKNMPNNIPDDTQCVYSYTSPKQATNINLDSEDPYKRYSNETIYDDSYQMNYYNESLNVKPDNYTRQSNSYLGPYKDTYTYCDLKDKLPSCALITCNNEEEHNKKLKEIIQNNKEFYNIKNKSILWTNRRYSKIIHNIFNVNSNNYLSKVLRL